MATADGSDSVRTDELREQECAADPFTQFERWMAQAVATGIQMPEAATLATATPAGRPSARMVLLKDWNEPGFTFFTNYQSRKARELDTNPFAALVVYWPQMQRQVRMEGAVRRVSDAESDRYFRTRPVESQIGAWASPQSAVIASRGELERRVREFEARFSGGAVPRPDIWGGFRLRPTIVEFWQGREGRLHDRIQYRFSHKWLLERLAP